jgi:DNA-binding PadR family transcriptional regulator
MFYSASYGSLQTSVKNLLARGMIVYEQKVENGRTKKVYSITEQGRREFFQWMTAEIPENKLEVTALSKVFFLGLIENVETKREIIREIVRKIELAQVQLSEMDQQLNQYEVPEDFRDIFKYQMKTLDYGIQAHVFGREWFQALLDDLENS